MSAHSFAFDTSAPQPPWLTPEAQARAYQEMVQSASDTILLIEDNRIIECNPAAEQLFGRSRDEILGAHPSDFSAERQADGRLSRDLIPQRLAEAMAGIHPTFTWRHARGDGREFTAEVSFSPANRVAVEGEATRGRFVWVLRDVSEQQALQQALATLNAELESRVEQRTQDLALALEQLRQAQDELIRSEKLASLGALVAGVSHELNTPIGNAVLVASTLRDKHIQFDQALDEGLRQSQLDAFRQASREALDVLARNLRAASELINSFKQVAVDQSSYRRRPFELGEVVHELHLTLMPKLRRANVQLLDQVQPGLRMDSYPGPLTQVLMNLVDNALIHAFGEACEAGADRTESAKHLGACQIRIEAEWLSDRAVHITVSDNGVGIAPQHLNKVFDPFFTTKLGQGGSGLGLHIAYTLVKDLLGGRLSVRSEVGPGTTFTIELPRHAPLMSPRQLMSEE